MKYRTGRFLVAILALVFFGIAGTQSATAQTFKRVVVQGKATLVQIAAGGASVWARASSGKPYILKNNKFVPANTISLTQIAVGGGNMAQGDTVWGLSSGGNVYTAAKSGTIWSFSQVPGVLDFIAVGPGYQDNCHPYEIWGLNPAAQIFRYNYCGQNWVQVAGTLQTLSVGGGEIWGINGNGEAFRFNFKANRFDLISSPNSLSQITVGPTGAWAIGSDDRTVYGYDEEFSTFFTIGDGFTQIQAGGSGVWGNNPGSTYRFERSTWSFVQIFVALNSISVGGDGSVWGINSSGQAFAFSTP